MGTRETTKDVEAPSFCVDGPIFTSLKFSDEERDPVGVGGAGGCEVHRYRCGVGGGRKTSLQVSHKWRGPCAIRRGSLLCVVRPPDGAGSTRPGCSYAPLSKTTTLKEGSGAC